MGNLVIKSQASCVASQTLLQIWMFIPAVESLVLEKKEVLAAALVQHSSEVQLGLELHHLHDH